MRTEKTLYILTGEKHPFYKEGVTKGNGLAFLLNFRSLLSIGNASCMSSAFQSPAKFRQKAFYYDLFGDFQVASIGIMRAAQRLKTWLQTTKPLRH